jgi:hypothetical protein
MGIWAAFCCSVGYGRSGSAGWVFFAYVLCRRWFVCLVCAAKRIDFWRCFGLLHIFTWRIWYRSALYHLSPLSLLRAALVSFRCVFYSFAWEARTKRIFVFSWGLFAGCLGYDLGVCHACNLFCFLSVLWGMALGIVDIMVIDSVLLVGVMCTNYFSFSFPLSFCAFPLGLLRVHTTITPFAYKCLLLILLALGVGVELPGIFITCASV